MTIFDAIGENEIRLRDDTDEQREGGVFERLASHRMVILKSL